MSTATLHIEKKKTLVPQLRFQEFKEEWKQTKLGNVCDKIQDGNYGGEYPKANEFVENGIPFLTSKALGGDGFLKEDKIDFIPIEKHIKLKKAQLKLNDVLFTNRGSNVGSIGLTDIRIAHGNIGPQLTLLRSNLKIISPFFLYQIMKSETTVKQIRSQDSGSAMNFFGIDTTSKFKLSIPTLPEQQKIASFLNAVDEKIQQLSRKKELLEQYKKGVMQQLFSGKLRFKDENGNNYPDWEEKKLKEFTKPVKRTTDRIIENIMTISGANGFMDQKDRFSQVIAAGSLGKYTHLLKDEFAYNRGNSKSYKYGCIYKLNHEEALIPYVYHSFKLDFGVPEFFEQIFKAKYLDAQLRGLISSSARMDGLLNIGANNFFQVKVVFPCIEEQQKIANFLSAIDSKIESVNQQLAQTQSFKKGLLQQMFV